MLLLPALFSEFETPAMPTIIDELKTVATAPPPWNSQISQIRYQHYGGLNLL